MILAGDIGGTKTVLAICDAAYRIVHEHVFHCADYPSLEAILDEFLAPGGRASTAPPGMAAACFGVAGPVVDGTAKITNLPWTIDAAALAGKLGVPVALLNDLQATALGMLVLPETAFAVLQAPAHAMRGGTIAVIAPGTGLGEALLAWIDGRYYALPSEGGHADFAPETDEEIELLRFMRARHGGHVSYERVLAGSGLDDVYDFVRQATGLAEPAWLTAAFAGHDRNAVISQAALDGKDAACVRTLALFTELLGAEAGNMALRGLATGGVVIGGGVPPKILPALQHPRVIERFNAKGRFSAWTRQLSVRVALEPRAALLGAAHHATALATATGTVTPEDRA